MPTSTEISNSPMFNPDKVNISASKMRNGDLLELARFAYFGDTSAFKTAFQNVGLTITQPSDVNNLVYWIILGKDKDGTVFKDAQGNPIMFDGANIIRHGIQISNASLRNAGLNFIP